MARLAFGGAELQTAADPDPDFATLAGASVSIDTAVPRSGAACYKMASSSSEQAIRVGFTETDGVTYFFRVWVRFDGTPAAAVRVVDVATATPTNQVSISLTTARKIQAPNGTLSAVLNTNEWHCLEISLNRAVSTHLTAVVTRLDGVQLESFSTTFTNVPALFRFGQVNGQTTGINLFFDDFALNDDSGAAQNSWPDILGKVVLLAPASDNAIGANWKLGTGTAPGGSAFDAVNNTPPLGVANGAAGSDAKQIRDATATATAGTDDADFNLQTYNAAGIPTGSAIKVAQALAYFSDPSTTLAPAPKLRIVSNPAEGSDTVGATTTTPAAGTWRSGWRVTRGPMNVNPSPTLGTAPVLRVGRNDTAATTLICCFAGVMVEWEPPVYVDSGSGGFTLAGSASEVKVGVDSGSGGFTLAGSASEVRVYVDSGSGGFTLAGSATEIFGQGDLGIGGFTLGGSADEEAVYVDSGSGGFTLSGSGVDEFTSGLTPPTPTPLEGLEFHITGLWYPDAVSVTYYGRIADPTGGEVRIPLNDSRTAKVTVETTDEILRDIIGHAYARMLRVYYHGTCVFWGPITLNDVPLSEGKVTISAVDPSIRLIHHFVRRGDIGGLLGADTRDHANVLIDYTGLRILRDAGINTVGQTARGVPDLGIDDGTNDVPDTSAGNLMGVARGDQVWNMMLQLSSASDGPDFELEPVIDTPGVYCRLNTYVRKGEDVSDTVQLHYGFNKDNLDDLRWTEGSKYTTHVQTLDRDSTYRVTPANLETSADTGPYVDWDVTDLDVHGMTREEAEDVLFHFGQDVLAAYSHPLIAPQLVLPVETEESFLYLEHYDVGSVIGAAGIKDVVELPEGDYRIVAVTLSQEGPENGVRPALDVISSNAFGEDTED